VIVAYFYAYRDRGRFIDAIGSNLLDNPIVKGIVVNLRDITERKHMEEGLQASERQYRLLAENLGRL
jgi:PAS domain-containing protein